MRERKDGVIEPSFKRPDVLQKHQRQSMSPDRECVGSILEMWCGIQCFIRLEPRIGEEHPTYAKEDESKKDTRPPFRGKCAYHHVSSRDQTGRLGRCVPSIKITSGKVISIHPGLSITSRDQLFLAERHKSFGVRSR